MNNTRHMSLAQFVAAQGGIYYQKDEYDHGELTNIRYHSQKLRGANAVFKKGGRPSDLLCIECMLEGYPVDENSFLELLEQDTEAWGQGSDRYRVLRDTDVDDTEELAAYLEDVQEQDARATCEVCECPKDHPSHERLSFEHERLEARHVHQLRGEAKAALYLSLFRFIFRDWRSR